MKKAAVLMDAGYVEKKFYSLRKAHPSPKDIVELAKQTVSAPYAAELFRIYYYDCPPLEERCPNPITGEFIDFSQTDVCLRKKRFHDSLSGLDYVAFRRGVLKFEGWRLKKQKLKELSTRSITADDIEPDFKQKRVDIKIGLDIAWLASKRIVDKIVLVTGDTDFIPAMKFARREGVQVVLVTLGEKPKHEMAEHADEVINLSL
jgi:uncharacterized LabA/DUF88 family protein